MRPGNVVRIRVNPTDSLSVLDVIDIAGINRKGMSYSQCVSLALASCLETFRQSGIVPERQGSEYLQMMEPFQVNRYKSQGRKLQITKAVQGLGSEIKAPAIVELDIPEAAPMSTKQMQSSRTRESFELPELNELELSELSQELQDLGNKREKRHIAGISWSKEDEQRYQQLSKIIFGG